MRVLCTEFAQPALANYVAFRMGTTTEDLVGTAPYVAIGFTSGPWYLMGAVIYNNFVWPDIHIHQAGEPGWLTKQTLRIIFEYPFEQLKCKRVTGLIPASNAHACDITERVGFQLEGVCRDAAPDGDMRIYGMLKSECRWIKPHGKKRSEAARSVQDSGNADQSQH